MGVGLYMIEAGHILPREQDKILGVNNPKDKTSTNGGEGNQSTIL